MRIRIVRATMAVVGGVLRAVDPGETVDVESIVGVQLIQLRKAVPVEPPPGGVVQTPEGAIPPTENRRPSNRRRR